MSFLKDKRAFAGILIAAILAIIIGGALVYIGLFVTATLGNQFNSTLSDVAASGTLTLTNNVACGERVNITNTNGILVPFVFNITKGCAEIPAGSINISFGEGFNTAAFAATNLTSFINNNASLSGQMVASNGSSGVVNVAYSTIGLSGNQVITTETIANGSWAAATLTGGNVGVSSYTTVKSNINTAFVVLGLCLLVAGFGAVIYVLRTGFVSGSIR